MLNNKKRRQVTHGIKYVFAKWLDGTKYIILVSKTFLGIFDHYYEKLLMAHRSMSEMINFLNPRLIVRNKRFLDNAVKNGQGALLVTGHFGAVEFLPLAMALRGYKVTMIVKFKTAQLKKALLAQANLVDVQLIDAEGPKVAVSALKALRNGRILITECDEFKLWRPSSDRHVSVFGNSMPGDRTLDFFYQNGGCSAFLGLMRRDKKGTFTLCIEPLDGGKKNTPLSARAWSKLEKYITNYPEQWYQWQDAMYDITNYIDCERLTARQEVIGMSTEYAALSSN
jgi:lauroyl/myristoyl acyltransferase